MARIILGCAIVAAVLGARAELASAGSCGGGSDDSDFEFDSDDEDWSSSSSSDGEGTYSRWAANPDNPDLVIELGVAVHTFANPLASQQRSVEHDGEDFTYRVVAPAGPDTAPARAVVSTLRIGLAGRHGFYGAVEGELGGLVTGGPEAEMITQGMLGAPSIEHSHGIAYGALAVAGLRGALGAVDLGAELAGGVRGVSHQYESRYLACEQTDAITANRGIVEARARAALWLSPRWNVGVQLGSSVLDRGAWTGGVFLGAHSHAYAGGR